MYYFFHFNLTICHFLKDSVRPSSSRFYISVDGTEPDINPSSVSASSVVSETVKRNKNDKYKIKTTMRQAIMDSIEEMSPEVFYNVAKDMHIIICGSPRVGKSTLINAICGREVTVTGVGLSPITQTISPHTTEGECRIESRTIHYKYTFWDTPGFESWEKQNIRSNIKEIFKTPEFKPLCMIFCASPGTFVDLSQLEWLLDFCIKEKHIFCALVCTNKYAGSVKSRRAVTNDFKRLLSKYVENPPREDKENDIVYYGNIGLCTSVNSEPYEDDDRVLPPTGVNELVYGILESLVDEEVIKWILLVLENKGFWDTAQQKVKETLQKLENLFTRNKTYKCD